MRFDPALFLIFPVFVLSVVVHECAHRPACLGLVGAPADGILP